MKWKWKIILNSWYCEHYRIPIPIDLPKKFFDNEVLNDLEVKVEKDARNGIVSIHSNTMKFVYKQFVTKILEEESPKEVIYHVFLPYISTSCRAL